MKVVGRQEEALSFDGSSARWLLSIPGAIFIFVHKLKNERKRSAPAELLPLEERRGGFVCVASTDTHQDAEAVNTDGGGKKFITASNKGTGNTRDTNLRAIS